MGVDGRDDRLESCWWLWWLSRGELGGDWSSFIEPPVTKEKVGYDLRSIIDKIMCYLFCIVKEHFF